VLLLVGRYVPVGLTILGPIIVNILVFHITLNPQGIGPGIVAAILEVFLIWAYWPAFRGIFTPNMER
jgi:putative oxidoreductase